MSELKRAKQRSVEAVRQQGNAHPSKLLGDAAAEELAAYNYASGCMYRGPQHRASNALPILRHLSAKTSSHPLAKTSSQPLAVLASDSAQAMQKRWEYVGHKSWVPGENIQALVKGGAQRGHSLNAAGLHFFGKCVMNVGKVSPELRQRLYMELSGRRTVAVVDAVTLVSALGGVSSTPDRPEAWRRRRPERLPPAIRCHLL